MRGKRAGSGWFSRCGTGEIHKWVIKGRMIEQTGVVMWRNRGALRGKETSTEISGAGRDNCRGTGLTFSDPFAGLFTSNTTRDVCVARPHTLEGPVASRCLAFIANLTHFLP